MAVYVILVYQLFVSKFMHLVLVCRTAFGHSYIFIQCCFDFTSDLFSHSQASTAAHVFFVIMCVTSRAYSFLAFPAFLEAIFVQLSKHFVYAPLLAFLQFIEVVLVYIKGVIL